MQWLSIGMIGLALNVSSSVSPWLVIDASGPFQSVSYDLARATLNVGAHWIDLADARDYLLGFAAALDPIARRKGLVARAGASSTPALSAAVVEDLTRHWQRLDSVDIAIMPGGAGRVGTAVIRAILSYAGTAIETYREGARAEITGWGSAQRTCVPGLGVRYLSPVETADAALLPERFNVTSRVAFYAGLEFASRTVRTTAPRQVEAARFYQKHRTISTAASLRAPRDGSFSLRSRCHDSRLRGARCRRSTSLGAMVFARRERRRSERAGASGRGFDARADPRRYSAGRGHCPAAASSDRSRNAGAGAQNYARTVIKAGEHNSFECGLGFKPHAKRRNAAKRAEAARL